jgi:hypothetical protein
VTTIEALLLKTLTTKKHWLLKTLIWSGGVKML